MSYTVKLYAWADEAADASPARVNAAIERFKTALNNSLGDAALVLPVYAAFTRIVGTYGDDPSEDALSPGEWAIFTQWRAAETAALAAALGSDRYMGDAQFEIRP